MDMWKELVSSRLLKPLFGDKTSVDFFFPPYTCQNIPELYVDLSKVTTSRTVSGSIPVGVTLGIFSVATDRTMCPGVDSASKNEYQVIPLGVKAAGA
jgi:hypothetical protein